jgi:hypothetical protein
MTALERDDCRRLLYVALGFLGLDVPSGAMPSGLRGLHAWLDTWHQVGIGVQSPHVTLNTEAAGLRQVVHSEPVLARRGVHGARGVGVVEQPVLFSSV